MASELYNVIDALSREKGINPDIVVAAVEDAIVVATRKFYKTQESLRAVLDRETGAIRAYSVQDESTPRGRHRGPADSDLAGRGAQDRERWRWAASCRKVD